MMQANDFPKSDLWHKDHARADDVKHNKSAAVFRSFFLDRQVSTTPLVRHMLESLRCPASPAEVYARLSGQRPITPGTFARTWLELTGNGFIFRLSGLFERPVIIVSAPRAGSTLLFETLVKAPDLWSVGGESHFILESLEHLKPENRNYDSHRLEPQDADAETCRMLTAAFGTYLRQGNGQRYLDLPAGKRAGALRLLEKTPRNALRVAFLNIVFPDALFVFLHRSARENIASIIDAWNADGFWQFKRSVPYCALPGWDRDEWCMLLPPGWRALNGKSLGEIASFQWRRSNEFILRDLMDFVPRSRWMSIRFTGLVADPGQVIRRICRFAGIDIDASFEALIGRPLPASSSTVSAPSPDKWRRHETVVNGVMDDQIRALEQRLDSLAQD